MTAQTPGQAAYEAYARKVVELDPDTHAYPDWDTRTNVQMFAWGAAARAGHAAIEAAQERPAPDDLVQRLANALADRQVLVIIGEIAEQHTLARPYDLAVQLLSAVDMRLTGDTQPAAADRAAFEQVLRDEAGTIGRCRSAKKPCTFCEAGTRRILDAADAYAGAQERPAPELAQAQQGLRDLADVHDALIEEALRNAGEDMDLIASPEDRAVMYVRGLEAVRPAPELAPQPGYWMAVLADVTQQRNELRARLAVTEAERNDLRQALDKRNALLDDFTHAVIDLDHGVAFAAAARAVREQAGMTVIDQFSETATKGNS